MIYKSLSNIRFLLFGILVSCYVVVVVSSFQYRPTSCITCHLRRSGGVGTLNNDDDNNRSTSKFNIDGTQPSVLNGNFLRLQNLKYHHHHQQERSLLLLKASKEEGEVSEKAKEKEEGSDRKPMVLLNTIIAKVGATTSSLVAGTFFIVLAYRRDAIMVSFFIGSILNAICSKGLKRIINQARPTTDNDENDTSSSSSSLVSTTIQPSDNGMPSSHAMSLGFIGTFTSLMLATNVAYSWIRIPLVVYVIISLIYRVQSKLHTLEQILVGTILGTFNGYMWYQLCFTNSFSSSTTVIEWVSKYFLNNESGVLPFQYLAIPAMVGIIVVGSFERRISKLLKEWKEEEKMKKKQ